MTATHSLPLEYAPALDSTATDTAPPLPARVWAAIEAWKSEHQALACLRSLDDRVLADIGLTRDHVSSLKDWRNYKRDDHAKQTKKSLIHAVE